MWKLITIVCAGAGAPDCGTLDYGERFETLEACEAARESAPGRWDEIVAAAGLTHHQHEIGLLLHTCDEAK